MAQDVVRHFLFEPGYIERRNAINRLAIDPQDFAAGHEDRGIRTQMREALGQAGRRVDDMFAISSTGIRCFAPTARATALADISPLSFSPSALATVDGM